MSFNGRKTERRIELDQVEGMEKARKFKQLTKSAGDGVWSRAGDRDGVGLE